ncbi:MAG: ABC transporter permease [Bacillota bacterium]
MITYIARRFLQMIPILLGATMLIFLVIKLAPGDPFSGMIDPRLDPRKIEELRQRYCLNCPLPQQYWNWMSNMLQGDLGNSIRFKTPVREMIQERMGPTLALGVSSQLLVFLFGLPIGILAATRRNTWVDNLVTIVAYAGLSIPSFFFGLLLLKWLALDGLKILPSAGFMTPGEELSGLALSWDILKHLILPALALGITSIAGLMSYVRSSMLEVLRQDYVRTARAKGLAERVVIYKHALRNAMIPVVTIIGLQLPALVGGAIITESIFMWPGIGRLAYTVLLERDYPVMMALNLMFAFLTMLGSLMADIGYALVDPRIRYD